MLKPEKKQVYHSIIKEIYLKYFEDEISAADTIRHLKYLTTNFPKGSSSTLDFLAPIKII